MKSGSGGGGCHYEDVDKSETLDIWDTGTNACEVMLREISETGLPADSSPDRGTSST